VEHLRSDRWFNFRQRTIEKRRFTCEACKTRFNSFAGLEVHHKTYDRLGRELDTDVAVLCVKCHQRVHGRKRSKHK